MQCTKDVIMYTTTASSLVEEAFLNTNHHVVCDNIDLDTILIEYENYYYLRYQKKPKISKPLDIAKTSTTFAIKNKTKTTKKTNQSPSQYSQDNQSLDTNFITITPLNNSCVETLENEYSLPSIDLDYWKDEWKVYAEIISKDILMTNPNVKWSDIKGLSTPKKLLDEAIVLPTKYPDLFTGLCTPWTAMLFYGPPGTGKTLLAKAVATECNTTFFNITPSTLVTKWRGDSEKLIKVMFEMAEHMSPSTIFIDELDTIASKRIDHEASRRLTSQILIHMDGLSSSKKRIFLLATSNHPWELDPAIFRRLEKRIFIDLPDVQARKDMFEYYLSEMLQKNKYIKCKIDSDSLAQKTNGYSGSDIKLICKETAMHAMRLMFNVLENKSSNHFNCIITNNEVNNTISKTKPSTNDTDNNKYKIWQSQYASY
ncbi:katanin p60 ATPase-containing subunit A-like 2 isoform X2 [Sipha flava]|uniref:Katanin p60 ATPase-containing subunit A-like 2 isoform X2 n=1 Tax=Sipha flava TaxID=143950 RepID=A0A8B8FQR3_9HEMI|nr:katanin p60 ATPase-containing subunit A-like 2 isoform X2 [Sipha flava]